MTLGWRVLGLVALVVLVVLAAGAYWLNTHPHHASKRDAHDLLTCVTGPDPEGC